MLPSDVTAEMFAVAVIVSAAPSSLNYPWSEEMFTDPIAKSTYRACIRLQSQGHAIDAMSVATDAERSGDLAGLNGNPQGRIISNVTEGYGQASSLEYYFNILSELHVRRKTTLSLMSAMERINNRSVSTNEVVESIVEASQCPQVNSFPSLRDQLLSMLAMIENNKNTERFSTGFNELDHALDGGYEKGEFLVYAGETSMGKSILLQMAALALSLSGKQVTFYSLEMPSTAILGRISANLTGTCLTFIGSPSSAQNQAISKAINQINKFKLTIRDNIFSLEGIMRDARAQIENGADAIIIDYIQRVEYQTKESREQAVAEVTRQMKRLAMQGNVCVLSASQLNEDGKVRESRAISQDCDILAVIKDGHISLDKFRRGERFKKIGCKLNGAIARFQPQEFNPEEQKPKFRKRG